MSSDITFIVIPTYNEAENIAALIQVIQSIRKDFQIIIVDDNSPDGTAAIVEEIAETHGSIIILQRQGKMGIGSAIRDGMKLALSFRKCKRIITMDADFSHDPQDIPRLLQATTDADLVQGSRYIKGGRIIGWSLYRRIISRVANLLYKWLFGLSNEVTTFFRVYSRECAEVVVNSNCADQYHFSVASALVIKDFGFEVKEVPITFVNRRLGVSKLSRTAITESLSFIIRTFFYRRLLGKDNRFTKFCIVGLSGVLVNEGILWMLSGVLGIYYLYSAIVSIESSIISNFSLNNIWTFREKHVEQENLIVKFIRYNLSYLIGVGLNIAILWVVTEYFSIHYLISNLFGIAVAVIWNYYASVKWVWAKSSK